MASSAVIWGLGDVTAQCLVPRQTQHASTKGWHAESGGAAKREAVKLERTAKQVAYASLVWTPVASFWYKLLETVACKVARQGTAKFVGTKVALEIVAFHPISLAAYFGCLGFAQGDGVPVIEDKFRRDFLPTLAGEILLWTPLDMCLFALAVFWRAWLCPGSTPTAFSSRAACAIEGFARSSLVGARVRGGGCVSGRQQAIEARSGGRS
eukprot:3372179-Rhodomonas_salina.1